MSRRVLPSFIPVPRRGVNLDYIPSHSFLTPLALRPCLEMPRIANLSMTLASEVPPPRSLLPPPAQPLQRSAPPQTESYGNGLDTLSARWGKKWYGNAFNLRRNLDMGGTNQMSKKRSSKFRMKKYHYRKRYKFRRQKLAAIGNTPFTKKVRVMMAGRFEHHTDKDIDAISTEQLNEATQQGSGSSTAGVRKRAGEKGRVKSKYQS